MSSRGILWGLLLCAPMGAAKAQDTSAGKASYTQHCVVCHGLKGKGNGPSGRALDPKPTDFTKTTDDKAEWFKAIKLGTKAIGKSKNMEGYAGKLSDEQIRDVIGYVKTFKASPP